MSTEMRAVLPRMLWVLLTVILATSELAAADVVIHGVVTDNAGKPIRGAEVQATLGDKSISRFSQGDGRYEITLQEGSYQVMAEAFGFAAKRAKLDTSKASEANFSLSPRWDVEHLSGAEIEQLIPNDADGKLLKGGCTACHDFDILRRRSGQTAAEWKSFLPNMTAGRRTQPVFTPEQLDKLSKALEKYLGPDSPYFGPDATPPTREQVHHPELADAALKATIYEWTIPTGADAFPHSISAANGIAYVEEVGARAQKFARFDLETEQFLEYPAPAEPHTGAIAKDGRVWVALMGGAKVTIPDGPTLPHMTVLDREGKPVKSFVFESKRNYTAHTPIIDHAGNVWLTVEYHGPRGSTPVPAEVWRFDVKTEQFKAYQIPVERNTNTYHVGEDSKGMIWASLIGVGALVRINPETGETKQFSPPNVQSIRGMVVDSHDNIWFAAFLDNKLGKLDQTTGTYKLYQPPTSGAAPYGIVEDKNTGYIWYADYAASQISRFDPKTEEFVEYPLPLHPSIPRFIDVDSSSRIWFTEYWNGRIGYLETGQSSKQK